MKTERAHSSHVMSHVRWCVEAHILIEEWAEIAHLIAGSVIDCHHFRAEVKPRCRMRPIVSGRWFEVSGTLVADGLLRSQTRPRAWVPLRSFTLGRRYVGSAFPSLESELLTQMGIPVVLHLIIGSSGHTSRD